MTDPSETGKSIWIQSVQETVEFNPRLSPQVTVNVSQALLDLSIQKVFPVTLILYLYYINWLCIISLLGYAGLFL